MPENSPSTVINNGSISSSTIVIWNLVSNDSQNNYIQIYPIETTITIGDISEHNTSRS